jgi:glycosyltransferase involved in cell wall biosynthesis
VRGPGELDDEPVHLHFTDRLLGATPAEAVTVVRALAAGRRTTLTLHDVPQPTDGRSFAARRDCYAGALAVADGWVTSSAAERATVERHCAPAVPGAVVPLPVVPVAAGEDEAEREPAIGVFGWVYPGKGHHEALHAAALLGETPDERPCVVALGAVAAGHGDLLRELHATADELGVRLRCTGWLDDAESVRRLRATAVPLVAHGNVSASGSLNSWLAAGRRPLVRSSAYAREMAALRPGTLELYAADATPADLAALVSARLADPDPGAGRVRGADLRPLLADTARAYRAWWAS